MTTINELCKAIQENNLEKVKQLLAQGINIDLYSDSEENPIWVAVENGSLKIVKLLLENALFENHLNKQKIAFSALWHVTTKEHCSIIKFLLEDTALDLKNHPDYYRKLNDALKYAASVDRFDIFKLFIEYRAPVTGIDSKLINNYIYRSGMLNNKFITLEQIVKYHVGVNQTNEKGITLLMAAAAHGRIAFMKELLEHCADVTMVDNHSDTALIIAAFHGQEEAVKLLIEHGAPINSADNEGDTALIHAAHGGHKKIVELLIANGAHTNHANRDGNTALFYAIKIGHKNIVKFLIAHGADVNQENKLGATPLIRAAVGGHYQIVQILIQNNAQINAQMDGNTALMFASMHNRKKTIRLLGENDAYIRAFERKYVFSDARAIRHETDGDKLKKIFLRRRFSTLKSVFDRSHYANWFY